LDFFFTVSGTYVLSKHETQSDPLADIDSEIERELEAKIVTLDSHGLPKEYGSGGEGQSSTTASPRSRVVSDDIIRSSEQQGVLSGTLNPLPTSGSITNSIADNNTGLTPSVSNAININNNQSVGDLDSFLEVNERTSGPDPSKGPVGSVRGKRGRSILSTLANTPAKQSTLKKQLVQTIRNPQTPLGRTIAEKSRRKFSLSSVAYRGVQAASFFSSTSSSKKKNNKKGSAEEPLLQNISETHTMSSREFKYKTIPGVSDSSVDNLHQGTYTPINDNGKMYQGTTAQVTGSSSTPSQLLNVVQNMDRPYTEDAIGDETYGKQNQFASQPHVTSGMDSAGNIGGTSDGTEEEPKSGLTRNYSVSVLGGYQIG